MEVIKRKIALDNYTSREQSNWGQMTASTFNINVFFIQDTDDMGVSTELPFIAKWNYTTDPNNKNLLVDYQGLIKSGTTIYNNGYKFNFMTGGTTNFSQTGAYPNTRYPDKTINQYFTLPTQVTGLTENRLDSVVSYDANLRYKPNFDITRNISAIDYQKIPFISGTRVIENNNLNPITYLIEGDTNPSELALLPITKRGIYYTTKTGETRTITSNVLGKYKIPYTEINYNSEGFNETNIHLSAETREGYLFGITESPKVFNDLFIDRGRSTVIQSHMQLSDITNMEELINYGNGFYNLQK
tara:strand:- start:881 stop:1783 length:903 start_codon:yes stop_codon:yes gene_type:complete